MEEEAKSNFEISRIVKKTNNSTRIKPSFYKNMGQVMNHHMEVINNI
jgi:hypothetical protein